MYSQVVSNTPLNAVQMVVVTESELAWERPDVEVLQLDMDWQKTRKKLMHIISKKNTRFVGCHV